MLLCYIHMAISPLLADKRLKLLLADKVINGDAADSVIFH